jgi:putative phage-type endonuclease
MEQQSAEWFAARIGRVTASRVADVIAKTKSGYSASRANYLAELVAERLSGTRAEGFTNSAMQWGTDQEPEARLAYEFRTDEEVEEVGFVQHPVIAMSGASPDGLVSDDGLIEIKCPNTATHIETLLTGIIPGKYETQMLWQMACTGRDWCDFASFDPRLPEAMRLYVKRFYRDNERIAELEDEVRTFLFELDTTVSRLLKAYGGELAVAA